MVDEVMLITMGTNEKRNVLLTSIFYFVDFSWGLKKKLGIWELAEKNDRTPSGSEYLTSKSPGWMDCLLYLLEENTTMIDGIISSGWALCLLCLVFFVYLFVLLGCLISFFQRDLRVSQALKKPVRFACLKVYIWSGLVG